MSRAYQRTNTIFNSFHNMGINTVHGPKSNPHLECSFIITDVKVLQIMQGISFDRS